VKEVDFLKAVCFSSVQDTNNYLKQNEGNNKGYVLFSSVVNVAQLSTKVSSNVVLCSSSGEYTNSGYADGVITGFEYNLSEAEIVEIKYPPVKSVEELRKAYSRVKSNKNAYMILLCDGLSKMEETILSTFYFMESTFKIIGGSAGDNLQFKETYIYIGTRRVRNVALFVDSKKRTTLIKENIYTKTGKTLLVTDADVINRTVKSFNNKPASTEYANMLGINELDLPKYFMNNPLGKAYENDIFIASPMKVNSDKSITFYCELMSNTFVHLLKPEDPITILRRTLESAPYKPSFVFSINCILRSLKFIEEGTWKAFNREMLKFCDNTTGFISYGEQYYKYHSNQTMVILLEA
jgi:hypothetical protein